MIYFRNDDVNPSSSYENITSCYNVIRSLFPDCKIISSVTLFSKFNKNGSVYEKTPFKNNNLEWFFDVDKFMLEYDYILKENIASHGLFHVDHSKISKDSQKMSILSSCNFLRTNIFVPPFNKWNDDTIEICLENKIRLLSAESKWKSLEFEKFDPNYKYWYFHSWRYSKKSLEGTLNAGIHNKENRS